VHPKGTCSPVGSLAYRGLLLDLDDTLFDRAAAFAAWADGMAHIQLGRPLDPVELADLISIDRRGHRSRRAFADDARRLGLAVDAEAFPFQLAEHVVAEPGLRETIEGLAHDRRVAIVTNGGAAQRSKLQRLGLASIVRTVFVSEELGIAKPNPEIFERALAWSELPARDVVFVGDMPAIDLVPAAALGMATAWRVRGEWPAELAGPTHRIHQITELATLTPAGDR
jgi:HAD superfamily hydrolase (TIGR01509 family)